MDSIPVSVLFIILVALILINGFFSGAETGMMSLNRYRLRHLVKKKHRVAKRVDGLLQRPDRLLGVILIGNTFTNILASAIATLIAMRLYGDVGVAVATVLLTFVVLIFSEVTPKTIAAYYAMPFAFIVSWPIQLLLNILFPVVILVNFIANGLVRLCGLKPKRGTADPLDREELRTVVTEASSHIPLGHSEMLLRILDLETITVEDVMIPRNEIVGIDLGESWGLLARQIHHCRHSRLVVYEEGIDNILGMLPMKRAVNLLANNKLNKENLRKNLTESYFIPEGTPLHVQLVNFKEQRVRSGLVVDEYGDIIGLVTLEDILEEIVGEFSINLASTSRDVHAQKDGSFLVDGGANVRELNRVMDWHLPIDGPKTLSGLIIERLEIIPNYPTGLRINGYPIEVVKTQGNTIKIARIIPDKRH